MLLIYMKERREKLAVNGQTQIYMLAPKMQKMKLPLEQTLLLCTKYIGQALSHVFRIARRSNYKFLWPNQLMKNFFGPIHRIIQFHQTCLARRLKLCIWPKKIFFFFEFPTIIEQRGQMQFATSAESFVSRLNYYKKLQDVIAFQICKFC